MLEAHNSRNVRDWLDKYGPGRWIGGGGPLAWPLRSPDLNSQDYLWANLNSIVRNIEINTREELLKRINLAANILRDNRIEILSVP